MLQFLKNNVNKHNSHKTKMFFSCDIKTQFFDLQVPKSLLVRGPGVGAPLTTPSPYVAIYTKYIIK